MKPNFSELGDNVYDIWLENTGERHSWRNIQRLFRRNQSSCREFQTYVWAPNLETAVERAKIKWDLAEKERGFRDCSYEYPVFPEEMRINNYDTRILKRRTDEGFVRWGKLE